MTFSAQRNRPYQKADSNLNLGGGGPVSSPPKIITCSQASLLKPPTGFPG